MVLLTGPSGCGKTRLTQRLGLPVLPLDNFYFNADRPGMPRRFGIVDWDSPLTWDALGAMGALVALCENNEVAIPLYDISTSSRIGETTVSRGDSSIVIAEGIFAAELVEPCRELGILASAICLTRPRWLAFIFRFSRDLKEARKPFFTLVRRGIGLFRAQHGQVRQWEAQGCHAMRMRAAIARIKELASD